MMCKMKLVQELARDVAENLMWVAREAGAIKMSRHSQMEEEFLNFLRKEGWVSMIKPSLDIARERVSAALPHPHTRADEDDEYEIE